MRKQRRFGTFCFAAAVTLIVLLAGCSGVQNKSEGDLEKTANGVRQAVENTTGEGKEELSRNGIASDGGLSAVAAAGKATELHMNNSVGSIEIKPVSGDKIIVKAKIGPASSPFFRMQQLKKLIEQSTVSVKTEDNLAEISVHPKGQPDQNLWNWAKSRYSFSEFKIDYQVEIPDNFNRFEIANDVGNLKLQNLKGTYRIQGDVGNVVIEGAEITGDSSVKTSTGSITLNITEMDSGSRLEASADLGSIRAALPQTMPYTLEAESELGEITGAAKGRNEFNGGGPLVSLTTSIGTISVE